MKIIYLFNKYYMYEKGVYLINCLLFEWLFLNFNNKILPSNCQNIMRKRLESPNISRSSVGNRHLSSGNDSRI